LLILYYFRLMADNRRSQDSDTSFWVRRSVQLYLLLSELYYWFENYPLCQRHKDVIVEQRQKRFESVVKVINPFVISEFARPYV